MAAKSRLPVTRSIKTPEALAGLRFWLETFDPLARERGETYFAGLRVEKVWADADHFVQASVRGTELYTVRLFLTRGAWSSRCSCPTGISCKHAYAAGRAWLEQCEENPAPPQPDATPAPAPDPTRTPPLQRDEESMIAEFAAITGQPPDRKQLAFLRNIALVQRSLPRDGHSWFDRSALAALALTDRRHLLLQDHSDPFHGWWVQPPATPLQLWPFIALLFTEKGIPLPAFMAPFDRLNLAREMRATTRREDQLRVWRQRFASLDQLTSSGPAPILLQALRVRLGAKKCVWEISSEGPAGPFRPLAAATLRALLDDPVNCAQTLDDAGNTLVTYLRAHRDTQGRATLNPANLADRTLLGRLLDHPRTRTCVVDDAGRPIADDPRPLTWKIEDHPTNPALAIVRLAFADGTPPPGPLLYLPAHPAFYLQPGGALFRGLPPLQEPVKALDPDFAMDLPRDALALPEAGRFAARTGVKLPGDAAGRFRAEPLRARLRARLQGRTGSPDDEVLAVELDAVSPEGAARARWQPDGWKTQVRGLDRSPDAAFLLHDFGPLQPVADHLAHLPGLEWSGWATGGGGYLAESTGSAFAENFSTWLAGLPADTLVELDPELAGLSGPPTRAHFALEVSENGIDWFDVRVALRVEDTTLTESEIQLLSRARGRFVRLSGKGWRRLELAVSPEESARFERLGLEPVAAEPGREAPRFHALQLADETLGDAVPDQLWRQIRDRADALHRIAPPPLPAGLRAELRPYQVEGFHFLAHLTNNHFGGVLADDMGLGKTLQTLAWLLWLSERPPASRPEENVLNRDNAPGPAARHRLRALVVCPKSVVFNWQTETARFAPGLSTARLTPNAIEPLPADADIVIANYAQLRLKAAALKKIHWDAVILDEGQNVKNPASATAHAARALRAEHRLVLTGTPIENRLLDLWSLFAFAQPGLLGGQTAFKRLYQDRENSAAAHTRLANRVRHFLLRRTKGQVARDLPPRTEEDIVVELEGSQRALYEAELKRTRQMLLGVQTARQFDAQRFNILQSLLRLRQICCDPRLIGAELAPGGPAGMKKNAGGEAGGKTGPSAKLEALLDTLEPVLSEGHRVLVFSQFVTMLELIRAELASRGIKHLLLTGQTENRQELVEHFQGADGPPVFLLSLKAAGAGLNLTAASYVVLYDPWWNPAVEAQAIDRTHRIGQTAHVIAYRLLARDTVEEKIRALQKEKAALAASVVQEESLATVMDLESLKRILS
jgi:superfamily II DNA or RNA helicase